MIPLFTPEDLANAKVTDKLPCECYECHNVFYKQKRAINKVINHDGNHMGKYCSVECTKISQVRKVSVICLNCQTSFDKLPCEIKKSKNNFCSKSCAATYNNKNKTIGTRRSKLEAYLESTLRTMYPTTEFHFNRKDAIGSELDIYIPSLRLAFELNGIFHCEPIFGQDKLDQIKSNDDAKFKACHDNNITLCMIDTSKQKYFKESTSKEFLDIILYHINFIGLVKSLANS